MICPLCKSKDIKNVTELDDEGDVERTFCASKDCGYILKEEVVTNNDDGTQNKRPRSIREEAQPDVVTRERRITDGRTDALMSVEEMTALAVRTQEETVGKASMELVKLILEQCAKHVLLGEYTYLVKEDEEVPGAILTQVVVELKGKGYKVKKIPCPGEGVNVVVKWPTKKVAVGVVKLNENLNKAIHKQTKRKSLKEKKSSLRKK